jgi:hypothetical protein
LIIRIQVINLSYDQFTTFSSTRIDSARMPRNMARTWHFGVNLRMPDLSQPEEVRDIFKEILLSAHDQIPIRGLEQCFLCVIEGRLGSEGATQRAKGSDRAGGRAGGRAGACAEGKASGRAVWRVQCTCGRESEDATPRENGKLRRGSMGVGARERAGG